MIKSFVYRSPMPASAEEVFRWHARPGAFSRLLPPWENVRVLHVEGPFGNGHRVTIQTNTIGPLTTDWLAELFDVEEGRQFCDRQIRGPFAHWVHTHSMIPVDGSTSILEDRIEYQPPLEPVGGWLAGDMIEERLNRLFTYRHAVTASDLRRIAAFRRHPPLTIAVTGASGLVGTDLCSFLICAGHSVVRLTRQEVPTKSVTDGTTVLRWNPYEPIDPALFASIDAVIHLAGDNVADGRWNTIKKSRIRDSRVGPTRRLAEALAKAGRPRVLVSASAIGYYGNRGDEILDETSPPGTGFFPEVCQAWEEAAEPACAAGLRVVHPRIGIVLSPKGGALAKQLPAFRSGGGAVLGDGRQWQPWISIPDLIGILYSAVMSSDWRGPINAVGPHPSTNREFGRTLATVLNRPFLLTLPAPVLRILFGEFADEGLLASARVIPHRLTDAGFQFDHPELAEAFRFLLGYRVKAS